VVWSQTSWRWLEVKMSELGMLSSTTFRYDKRHRCRTYIGVWTCNAHRVFESSSVHLWGESAHHQAAHSLHIFLNPSSLLLFTKSPLGRFCFVLDKTSMFKVESFKPDGTLRKHQVGQAAGFTTSVYMVSWHQAMRA
jgi:hypothetical protein